MKTKIQSTLIAFTVLTLVTGTQIIHAQGTAFTYQGRLNNNGVPANGSNDFTFAVFSVAVGGSPVAGPLKVGDVPVTNGLFTATVDFGAGVFTGTNLWLEIGVRPGDSSGGYTDLAPRQLLTPTPYAIHAASAAVAASANTVTWSGLNGVPSGFADGVDNDTTYAAGLGLDLTGTTFSVNPLFTDGRYWALFGNAGTSPGTDFLGTTDNQAMELRVNNQRALRLQPDGISAPSIIGGSANNSVAAGVAGATIAGGRFNTNQSGADYSTIGGGDSNLIQANASDSNIGGGWRNTIQNYVIGGTIAGGLMNKIQTNANQSAIGGGFVNGIAVGAENATISGGFSNTNTGSYAAIPGGDRNVATNHAFAAGHRAKANHQGAFVWADSTEADFASTTTNQLLIRASGGVGIGKNNPATMLDVNGAVTATGDFLGERLNIGFGNELTGIYATIGGGSQNTCWGDFAVVPGGRYNSASGAYSFAAGFQAEALDAGCFVWSDANFAPGYYRSTGINQFRVRASGGVYMEGDGGSAARQLSLLQNYPGDVCRLWMGVNSYPGWTISIQNSATPELRFGRGYSTTNVVTFSYSGDVTAQSFNPTSDRNAKENFEAVSARAVLAKVAALPISRWNFKNEKATPHIGPMAQDFHAAFGVGPDDKHIATVDADGVALAAIQGLNQKVEDLNGELKRRDTENAELKRELSEIKRLLLKLSDRKD